MKNLAEMANSIEKFPEDLPEDFVNQKALENLEIGKTQNILDQINKAMEQGNVKKALELAQQFLDMSKQMKSQLEEAHESYLNENSAEDLANEISEQQKKMEEINEEQRKLLAETQKLESKRLVAQLKEQKKLLEKLAEEQKKGYQANRRIFKGTKTRSASQKSFGERIFNHAQGWR